MTERISADKYQILRVSLIAIAQGKPNSGRALPSEDARQVARVALIAAGLDWTKAGTTTNKGLTE